VSRALDLHLAAGLRNRITETTSEPCRCGHRPYPGKEETTYLYRYLDTPTPAAVCSWKCAHAARQEREAARG
jgi:hypothetical protein